MSTNERPIYVPRSPVETVFCEFLTLLFTALLGLPASIGFFAGLWALTSRDAGEGALLGLNIGIVLISLVALGNVLHHLRWTLPILRATGRGCLWLLCRPRLSGQQRPQAVILQPPQNGGWMTRNRQGELVPLRRAPVSAPEYMPTSQPSTAEHVIVRTPDSADLCLVIEEGIYQGDWSRSTLCSRLGLLSQPRWRIATDRLVAMGVLAPGKTDLEADLDSIRIVEPSEIQP